MSRPDLDIITSPSAERMLDQVTYGFYDRSRIALWMFEVIGREYDDMAAWARELRREIFPQTCTWSIAIWEFVYGFEPDDSKTLGWRRNRILSHRMSHPPINPARIEAALSAITGTPVHITEHVAPYTFRVDIEAESGADSDGGIFQRRVEAIRLLRRIKPSHLSFVMTLIISFEVAKTQIAAAGTAQHATKHLHHPIPRNITQQYNHKTPAVTAATTQHAVKHISTPVKNKYADSLMFLEINGELVPGLLEIDGVTRQGILEITASEEA